MNNNPLISVIVPCYKVELYLPKCVDSILRQTYQNIEVFLVDDGSPDNCGAICDKYAQEDNRVIVIHKTNGGLSDARNVAIDVAHGEYITFVDGDDYVADDYIETLHALVKKFNSKVGVALYTQFFEGQTPVENNDEIAELVMTPYDAVEKMFYQEIFDTSAWAKIYHKSLFDKRVRYPKGLLYEDLPTTYLLMLNSNAIALTNKHIYYYLLRSSSIEGAYNPKKIQSGLSVTKLMEEHFDLLKPIEKAYRCRKVSLFFHLVLPMPNNADGRDIMVDYIRKNRLRVLFDKRARKKTRVAVLLSYLGLNTLSYVYSLTKSR